MVNGVVASLYIALAPTPVVGIPYLTTGWRIPLNFPINSFAAIMVVVATRDTRNMVSLVVSRVPSRLYKPLLHHLNFTATNR